MSPTLFLTLRRLVAVGRVSSSHAFDTRRGIPVGVRVRDSFRKSYMGNSDGDPLIVAHDTALGRSTLGTQRSTIDGVGRGLQVGKGPVWSCARCRR